MANTTKKVQVDTNPKIDEVKVEDSSEKKVAAKATTKRKITSTKIDMNELVNVQSCSYGGVVYISKKTGYRIEWPEFGTIQMMTVDELMTMRNSQPAFFKNGWVRLVGDNADTVKQYLQLERYYKNDLDFEDFDEVYELSADEIIAVVSELSDSMKESIARRAIDLIKDGTIDSKKKIAAIETATGFDLSE